MIEQCHADERRGGPEPLAQHEVLGGRRWVARGMVVGHDDGHAAFEQGRAQNVAWQHRAQLH